MVGRHRCSFPDVAETDDEQSRTERLEIARRYRERRGAELKALAAAGAGRIEAAGEFGTVPTEALASVPGLGLLLVPLARRRSRRSGLPPKLLLALDDDHLIAFEIGSAPASSAREVQRWTRHGCSIERSGRVFMRDRLALAVPDRDQPITLYVSSLITNPWSAEVVRLLGGEAPEPLDLGADDA